MDEIKLRDILKEYQFKRDRKEDELKQRIDYVYKRFPDIKQISDEIVNIGLQMTRLVVLNSITTSEEHNLYGDNKVDEKNTEEISKNTDENSNKNCIVEKSPFEKKLINLEIKQDSLIDKKNMLLKQYKVPEGYLEMKYDCIKCKDTGYVESGRMCKCLKQRMINDAYNNSNMINLLSKQNFDTFDIEVFPEEEVEGINVREEMQNIMMNMYSYASNFPNVSKLPFLEGKENIILTGTAGLGKTFLCSCVAKELLDKGFTVIYQTAFDLMEVIEKHKFKRDSYTSIDEKNYNNIFDCDLLIIDDLGTEMPNSFTVSEIFNVINSRIINDKKIIISTNLGFREISDTYTDRVMSRILGHFKSIVVVGDDLRVKLKI